MQIRDLATITSREITPEGFLLVGAKITRSGVLEYRAFEFGDTLPPALKEAAKTNPNLTVRILRPETEVFDEESMASFANKPVTFQHPTEFVNAENVRSLQVGFSRDAIVRDGDFLRANLVIQDRRTIRRIESDGVSEVSIGANAEVDWTPGIDPGGGHYDGSLRGIRGNHIALVPRGRAGHNVRLDDSQQDKGVNMTVRKYNGISVELTDAAIEVIDGLEAKLADVTAEAEKAKGEFDVQLADATKEIEELKGKLDAEKANMLTDEDVEAKVKERMDLVDSARKLDADLDPSGKSPMEIRKCAILSVSDSFELEDKSEDYINAVFETLLKTNKPVETKDAKPLADALAETDGKKKEDEIMAARQKMMDAKRDAWKTGLEEVL